MWFNLLSERTIRYIHGDDFVTDVESFTPEGCICPTCNDAMSGVKHGQDDGLSKKDPNEPEYFTGKHKDSWQQRKSEALAYFAHKKGKLATPLVYLFRNNSDDGDDGLEDIMVESTLLYRIINVPLHG